MLEWRWRAQNRLGDTVGGRGGTRTPDPLLAKQVLCQLSYTPIGGTGSDSKAFATVPKIKSSSLAISVPELRQKCPREQRIFGTQHPASQHILGGGPGFDLELRVPLDKNEGVVKRHVCSNDIVRKKSNGGSPVQQSECREGIAAWGSRRRSAPTCPSQAGLKEYCQFVSGALARSIAILESPAGPAQLR